MGTSAIVPAAVPMKDDEGEFELSAPSPSLALQVRVDMSVTADDSEQPSTPAAA